MSSLVPGTVSAVAHGANAVTRETFMSAHEDAILRRSDSYWHFREPMVQSCAVNRDTPSVQMTVPVFIMAGSFALFTRGLRRQLRRMRSRETRSWFAVVRRKGAAGTSIEARVADDVASAKTAVAAETLGFSSSRVERLKDMLLIKEMRIAISSGEFALRLKGAELSGLLDYDRLCDRLYAFLDKLERQPPDATILPHDECWKAAVDLQDILVRLQGRRSDLHQTKTECGVEWNGTDAGRDEPPRGEVTPVRDLLERSGIILYLRSDKQVDIAGAIQESCAAVPFSRDLSERLRGRAVSSHDDEWARIFLPKGGSPTPDPTRVGECQEVLNREQRALRLADTSQEQGVHVLVANLNLLMERSAVALEGEIEQVPLHHWGAEASQLRQLVVRFSLLDKQVAPYLCTLHRGAEMCRASLQIGVDYDELKLVEERVMRFADLLGVEARPVLDDQSSVAQQSWWRQAQRRHSFSFWRCKKRVRRGLMFYANGLQLLSEDLQHVGTLVLKATFLKHSLAAREMQICFRAVKDLLVLVPFLVILLIPLSPPGHVFVFSLMQKIFPDFFPSFFTERRQNIRKIYTEIRAKRIDYKRSA